MLVLWLILNVAATVWFAYLLLVNPILMCLPTNGRMESDAPNFVLLMIIALVGAAVAVALCFVLPLPIVVVASALSAFATASGAHHSLQRFAGVTDRTIMATMYPSYLPMSAFILFVAAHVACVACVGWLSFPLPFAIWLVLGFICAELAIRRHMRRLSKFKGLKGDENRRFAIFIVNSEQGRPQSASLRRYPFP